MNRRGLMKAIAGLLALPFVGRNTAASTTDNPKVDLAIAVQGQQFDGRYRTFFVELRAFGAAADVGDLVILRDGKAYPCRDDDVPYGRCVQVKTWVL